VPHPPASDYADQSPRNRLPFAGRLSAQPDIFGRLLLTFLNAADQSPFAWNYQIKKTPGNGRVK
jgi:hypothetical protein